MSEHAQTSSPASSALDAFRGAIRGRVVTAADAEYDRARQVWNGMMDRHPAMVVYCSGNADVISAVNYARAQGLPVAVRSGGHNVAGAAVCDKGLVIDLSLMKSVRVDPERRRVRVGGGARLGDLDHETQPYGLGVPVGVVSATGIGGLTLHGGMGFLTRRLGLTVDHLVGADVVTADGTLHVVDEHHEPDLLWALQGGGGNFGVVTSFEFRLNPVGPDVWMLVAMYPAAETKKVLSYIREFGKHAPDELMLLGVLWSAPNDESIPEPHRGTPVCIAAGCYSGPVEDGERIIAPLRSIATPVADFSGPMPFLGAQRLFDPEYPDGRRYYWKSTYLSSLDDHAIDVLAAAHASRPSPMTSIDLWTLGGAFARVDPSATAFALRKAPYLLGIESNWIDRADDDRNVSWTRDLYQSMQRFSPGGSYLNFPGFAEEGESLVKASYGANYTRLQTLKRKYDPDNLFRHNFNIKTS